MVKLIVEDFDQMSILESALMDADIEYSIEEQDRSYGIKPPHLIVDGVPLDMGRALNWIKEHSKHE